MNTNTIKSTLGFLHTLLVKYTPLTFDRDSIAGIFNYLPINESLGTSGQPTENQLTLIKAAGYTTVINLAPHDAENSLPNEATTVSSLGMKYIHIPVNFINPTDKKFDQYAAAMRESEGEKVWVHCAANMRVSAFVYRYRCNVLGEDREIARRDMEKIWEPLGPWKAFLAEVDR